MRYNLVLLKIYYTVNKENIVIRHDSALKSIYQSIFKQLIDERALQPFSCVIVHVMEIYATSRHSIVYLHLYNKAVTQKQRVNRINSRFNVSCPKIYFNMGNDVIHELHIPVFYGLCEKPINKCCFRHYHVGLPY